MKKKTYIPPMVSVFVMNAPPALLQASAFDGNNMNSQEIDILNDIINDGGDIG